MKKDVICVASWSGGKDSTFLIDEMLRGRGPLDEIVFCDTGYEFPMMYTYIEKMKKYWEDKYGAKITLLNWKQGKEIWHKFSEGPFSKGQHKGQKRGFPYSVGMSWCTRELKVKPMQNYIKEKYSNKEIVFYVGIAYNEPDRVKDTGETYPLVEWKITEDEIAKILAERGLHNPLYNHFHRTGCFTCPKQSLTSLYKLWKHYPEQWRVIRRMQSRYTKENAGVFLFRFHTWQQLQAKFIKYEAKGKPTHYLEEALPIGCMCK